MNNIVQCYKDFCEVTDKPYNAFGTGKYDAEMRSVCKMRKLEMKGNQTCGKFASKFSVLITEG